MSPLSVAILQSNYIPWKGYFDIIAGVDLFVFYDDVQYTKNDWRNRNRIKTHQGVKWLTIPCGPSLGRRIHEVRVDRSRWQERHWKTIRQSYSKAPFFEKYRPLLEPIWLGRTWERLSELNQHLIKLISQEIFELTTAFDSSHRYELRGSGSDRVLELLGKLGATSYLSGPSAKSYLVERDFEKAGIELRYMDYSGYPEYPQMPPGPFAHHVTILDLLFNVGPEATRFMKWGAPSAKAHQTG